MSLIMTSEGWRQLGDGKVCSNSNFLMGCFRSATLAEVQRETAAHTDAFCRVLEEGDMRKIKDFNFGLRGPFGEKL